MPRQLTLYIRENCHLCELMRAGAEPLLRGSGISLESLDIDTDPSLKERFDWRVPVLADGDEIICEGRFDEGALLDFLQENA